MRDGPQLAVSERQERFIEADVEDMARTIRALSVKADLAGGHLRISADKLRQMAEWAEEKEAEFEEREEELRSDEP